MSYYRKPPIVPDLRELDGFAPDTKKKSLFGRFGYALIKTLSILAILIIAFKIITYF